MKNVIAGFLFLLLSVSASFAGQSVVYEVISTKTGGANGQDPWTFNAASFTQLNLVAPGASCGSCFGVSFFPSERFNPAKRVMMEFAFYDANCGSTVPCTSATQVRLISFYYDQGTPVYNRTWPAKSKNPNGNPSHVGVDVTAQWNAYMAGIPATAFPSQGFTFIPEVVGNGSIYMARIVVEY